MIYILSLAEKKPDEIGRCWYFLRKEKKKWYAWHYTAFIKGGGDNDQVMRLIICKMFYYYHPLYGTVPLSGCLLDTKHDM